MNKLLLVLIVPFLLFACEHQEEEYEIDIDNIAGVIQSDITLEANGNYGLDGVLLVEKGGVLHIEPGVTITVKGNSKSYVAIARGGKIDAQGTASAPIVFTSDIKEAGSWGGLVVCGNAPSNLMTNSGQPIQAEVTDMLYGGSNEEDNSGILTYVRVEYSGYSYDDDKQFNGFSFFGVGSGTIIQNIASYESLDDGIEFFGGNADANYLVSINSHDDGIDFTDGWQGLGAFWYAFNSAKSGIEGSNNESNSVATPSTNAQLSNVTVYKMGERPWYMKKGAGNQLVDNVVIGGLADNSSYPYFYHEDGDETTINRISQGSIRFTNVRFFNRGLGNDSDASGNLIIDFNAASVGAGAWSNDTTLAPSWAGTWAGL